LIRESSLPEAYSLKFGIDKQDNDTSIEELSNENLDNSAGKLLSEGLVSFKLREQGEDILHNKVDKHNTKDDSKSEGI